MILQAPSRPAGSALACLVDLDNGILYGNPRDLRSLVTSSGPWADDDLPSTSAVLSRVRLMAGDPVAGQPSLNELAARAFELHRGAVAQGLLHLVRPSVPILFFGDSARYAHSPIKVITVGLNPSLEEFPRSEPFRRFPDCTGMGSASEPDSDRYVGSLNAYFGSNAHPYSRWFRPSFEPILQGIGASYYDDEESAAIHTDLCSPLATDPTWRDLSRAEQEFLSEGGVELWHELAEVLQPDVVIISVGRELLGEIRFPASTEEQILHTVEVKKDGTKRQQPYLVLAQGRTLSFGKEALFVFGRAAQTPFGSVSAADKHVIGGRIRQVLARA